MISQDVPLSCKLEALRLEAIAEELHRLADEATERWRAAIVRAEGTPLLDPLKEQDEWGK